MMEVRKVLPKTESIIHQFGITYLIPINNCIEQVEEFIIELIKDSKYQDKDYYKNLMPLDFNTLLSYLINNKNLLINKYKMKSLYIFGSYYLKTNRFDSDIDLYVIFLDVSFIEKEKLVKEVKDVLFNHFRRFIDIEEIFEIPSNGYKVFWKIIKYIKKCII